MQSSSTAHACHSSPILSMTDCSTRGPGSNPHWRPFCSPPKKPCNTHIWVCVAHLL